MCGIAGIIACEKIPAKFISAMTDLVRHRGPDDEGFFLLAELSGEPLVCGGNATPEGVYLSGIPSEPACHVDLLDNRPVRLALGHRRLSIVDLSPTGHQPMCYRDRYWITYNGEIYNHLELRRELESHGHRFSSNTDTEVILAAYDFWGEDCLHRFNGMWAFAIYDTKREELFLSRDRFGVKPLYYWCSPAGFVAFASEIKQFTALPGWMARVNGQRAYDFLAWAVSDHTDETLFAGIFQLRQGQCCTISLKDWTHPPASGKLPMRQWYELPHGHNSASFPDAVTEVKRLFSDGVGLRLRADVPVGSCLSGGLDSSSIVCVMDSILKQQGVTSLQKTYSAASEVKRLDERKWIEQVVQQTGVGAHYLTPSLDQLFAEIPAIVWHQDEPFGSTSIYAQWSVFRMAAQNGTKVMLDGQGADEYLAGYHSFFAPVLAGLLLRGNLVELARELVAGSRVHGFSAIELLRFIGGAILPDGLQRLIRNALGLHDNHTPTWLDSGRIKVVSGNPWIRFTDDNRDLRRYSKAMLTTTCLPMLLHWEDRDSMAHSIETRLPFLDYRLVEFVLSLPDEYKLYGGISKRVLRAAMHDILPEPIRNRTDKIGFATAEEEWLRDNSALFRQQIQMAIEVSGGIVRPSAYDLLDGFLSGTQSFSFNIWRIISFGAWMSRFSVSVT